MKARLRSYWGKSNLNSKKEKIVDEIKTELDKQEEIKRAIETERNKIDEIIEKVVTHKN